MISLAINRMKGPGRNFLNALTTNTVSATMLEAGSKVNVIPSSAEVALDCRLVPGQTPEDVMREIKAITGDGVELEVIILPVGQLSQPRPRCIRSWKMPPARWIRKEL